MARLDFLFDKSFVKASDALKSSKELILKRQRGEKLGYVTRWARLTKQLGGEVPLGTTFAIAARPGIGKSTIANLIAIDTFKLNEELNTVFLYWNWEMPSDQQGLRFISNKTKKSYAKLVGLEQDINDNDFAVIDQFYHELSEYNIFYIDERKSPSEIYKIVQAVKAMHKDYNIVNLFDHSRLVAKDKDIRSEEEKITSLYSTCAKMAKDFNSLNYVLSQLNREQVKDVKQSANNYRLPAAEDLFGSDGAAQFSNIILCLDRPEIHNIPTYSVELPEGLGTKNLSTENLILGNLAKNRNGPMGHLYFEADMSTFTIEDHKIYQEVYNLLRQRNSRPNFNPNVQL
jgi:replicative DNA helicase